MTPNRTIPSLRGFGVTPEMLRKLDEVTIAALAGLTEPLRVRVGGEGSWDRVPPPSLQGDN